MAIIGFCNAATADAFVVGNIDSADATAGDFGRLLEMKMILLVLLKVVVKLMLDAMIVDLNM